MMVDYIAKRGIGYAIYVHNQLHLFRSEDGTSIEDSPTDGRLLNDLVRQSFLIFDFSTDTLIKTRYSDSDPLNTRIIEGLQYAPMLALYKFASIRDLQHFLAQF